MKPQEVPKLSRNKKIFFGIILVGAAALVGFALHYEYVLVNKSIKMQRVLDSGSAGPVELYAVLEDALKYHPEFTYPALLNTIYAFIQAKISAGVITQSRDFVVLLEKYTPADEGSSLTELARTYFIRWSKTKDDADYFKAEHYFYEVLVLRPRDNLAIRSLYCMYDLKNNYVAMDRLRPYREEISVAEGVPITKESICDLREK